jgi:Ca2+-binding EF-hand superfamily protein
LKQHENYLKAFTKIFRKIDKDNDGVLNEQEFMKLVEKEFGQYFVCSKDEISYFLQELDPFNTQKITFSQMV